jgi:hypothetical protein
MTKTADPNHTANQYAVARRLTAALLCSNSDPAVERALRSGDLSWMSETAWAIAVDVAKDADPAWNPRRGYVPSWSTKRLIAEMIRTETSASNDADPFAGLPS